MAEDIFGVDSLNEAVAKADFLDEKEPPAEAPTETQAETPEPSIEESRPADDNLYPGRARDPETGRFIKSEEAPESVPAEETVAEAVEEAQEAARVWAGKYQSPDQLEKGYRELRDLQRRTAERSKAYEQRVQEVEFQARQMEDAVRRATEVVRQMQLQQQQPQVPQQPLFDQYGNPVQAPQPAPMPQGLTPDQIEQYVAQQVNERMAYQARAMQEQQDRQQAYQEAKAAQAAFFQAHPDVVKDGSVDEDIANTILALNEAWSGIDGSSVDIRNQENLEIAYEAAKRPALRVVLEKNPTFFDDDAGLEMARALANQIDGTQAPSQPQGRMQPRPNTPVVERGSSPAPAQQTPLDEFDQAVAEYRNATKSRGSEVFFN